jgi:hypothetical protein
MAPSGQPRQRNILSDFGVERTSFGAGAQLLTPACSPLSALKTGYQVSDFNR